MTVTHIPNQQKVSTRVPLDSVALQRLLDEVKREKNGEASVGGNYDRVHNRHNR